MRWLALSLGLLGACAAAQTPPSRSEIGRYQGLHSAAVRGDAGEIGRLHAAGAKLEARDGSGRTPLHVAVYFSHRDAARTLLALGADANALEHQRYDVVTIAAVANDLETLRVVLRGGASAKNVTSPYDGTALIAAAHLGHAEVVRELIQAGAPLDHVNNLGWTALIEAIVLGDGGARHLETLRALIEAGASVNLGDRRGARARARARPRLHRNGENPRERRRALSGRCGAATWAAARRAASRPGRFAPADSTR